MPAVAEFLRSKEALGSWNLVPERSTFGFANKSLWGLQTVNGRFTDVSGHGQVSDTGEVTGELDIAAHSVDTGLRMRDRHLRSADFFKADRFPRIVVVVTAARPADDDTAEVEAFITVTGTTKPLPLKVTMRQLDDGTVNTSTRATINHDELGIRWNKLWMLSRKTTVSAEAVFRHEDSRS